MTDFLLKLLGVRVEDAGRISGIAIDCVRDRLGWVILAALLLGAGVFWLYRRSAEHVPRSGRYLLASLRWGVLLLMLALLLKPVLALTVEGTIRRTLLLLLDSSSSMRIEDPRTEKADLERVAIARGQIDPAKGLAQPLSSQAGLSKVARVEVLRQALRNDKLDLVQKLHDSYNLRPFAFGRTIADLTPAPPVQAPSAMPRARFPWGAVFMILGVLAAGTGAGLLVLGLRRGAVGQWLGGAITAGAGLLIVLAVIFWPQQQRMTSAGVVQAKADVSWIDKLGADSPVTAGGDALRELLARTRGQPLAGIVMATDGGFNSGAPALDAALIAKADGVPLYIYGVGISAPKDLIVANLFAPEVVFARDEAPVTVRVRGQGMAGESARLLLKLRDKAGVEKQFDSREVTFPSDGEQVLAMNFTPDKPGEYELIASIDPRDDEVVKDNNIQTQHIRVVDDKIKVLIIEQQPRWEFKYLQAMLARDRRVELKSVLLEADEQLTKAKDSPYLPEIPKTKADLQKFDLIILGDVDARAFSSTQLESINEFVSKFGGGLLMIAGKRANPWTYAKTPIEKMLPVEFDASDSTLLNLNVVRLGSDEMADKPVRMELSAAGKRSPMLRLSDKEQESSARWAKLPPIFWTAKVNRAKPAADVLMVDPDPARASRFGKMPIIAMQGYGLGQVMFVGTDNTWRWRKNVGDLYYTALWGQIVQRLSLPHLLGGSKRTQLSTDRRDYVAFDKVTIYARLYTESYEPVTDPQVKGHYESPGGAVGEVPLRALPEQPGMYRGEFVAPAPGAYQFWVERDPGTRLDFNVTEPKLELGETAMNEKLLREMASATGGAFLREEDLHTLSDQVHLKTERIQSRMELELWSSPLFFLLIVALATAEWILRKVWQLK